MGALKVIMNQAAEHLEKANAFSLQNHAGECDSFSHRAECNSPRLAGFAPVGLTFIGRGGLAFMNVIVFRNVLIFFIFL